MWVPQDLPPNFVLLVTITLTSGRVLPVSFEPVVRGADDDMGDAVAGRTAARHAKEAKENVTRGKSWPHSTDAPGGASPTR